MPDILDKYSGQFVNAFNTHNNLLRKKKTIMLNINLIDIHFCHAQQIFILKSKFH